MSQPFDKLAELLLNEKQRPRTPVVGTQDAVRELWIRDLHALMAQIAAWLADLRRKGLLTVVDRTVGLREEALGQYRAPALEIRTPAGRTIEVLPRGRWVFHGIGTVDILCAPRRARLARLDRPGAEREAWYFVTGPDTSGPYQTEPLAEESFGEVLQELLS